MGGWSCESLGLIVKFLFLSNWKSSVVLKKVSDIISIFFLEGSLWQQHEGRAWIGSDGCHQGQLAGY